MSPMKSIQDDRCGVLGNLRLFSAEAPNREQIKTLEDMARSCRLDAVLMTGLAGSGHPAGSLSSMDIYNILYATANLTCGNFDSGAHDKIIASHGHTSPGVYAALAAWGFIPKDEAVANFRRAGSPYQGHVERAVPGIDWGTGNLGQGLSAGVGFAIADKILNGDSRVFVVMGDGEQPKGQVAEARRIAAKERLSNITALIDMNGIQIGGDISKIMPADIKALWEADGWTVAECDGHDYAELYAALKSAVASSSPTVILCRTVMGKGVSFMEGIAEYHGKAASGEKLVQAVTELGGNPEEIDRLKALRRGPIPKGREIKEFRPSLVTGEPRTYTDSDKRDARGAFGAAVLDVAKANADVAESTPIIAFDCDLLGSVKLDSFAKEFPECLLETGIQEHATASVAGAASIAGVVPVWADFGVFGMDEVYNQQRLNAVNCASAKTVLTHVGLDVGEDGMTHQCIDYVGLLNNIFGWRLIVPADANQTDRATRWMLGEAGNICLAVGRSVKPVLKKPDGTPLYGGDYKYEYGKIDVQREGRDVTIMALGQMAVAAAEAAELLAAKGIEAKVLVCSSPLDMDVRELISMIGDAPLVTCEDHNVETGLGAIAAVHLARAGVAVKMKNLGVSRFGESGAAGELMKDMGLAAEDIAAAATSLIR